MKVINKNVGTSELLHYCPVCDSSVTYNGYIDKFVGNCPHCDIELEFPNTAELLDLMNL